MRAQISLALGAVLHESVTQKRAFPGDSYAAVIAAIDADSQPLSMAMATANAGRTRPGCRRPASPKILTNAGRNAGDLARESKLDRQPVARSARSLLRYPASTAATPNWWIAAIAVLALSTLVMAIDACFWGRTQRATTAYRTLILLPEGLLRSGAWPTRWGSAGLALSRNGAASCAFVASDPEGNVRLWVRSLVILIATSLPDSDGAGIAVLASILIRPWLGFAAQRQLKDGRPIRWTPTTTSLQPSTSRVPGVPPTSFSSLRARRRRCTRSPLLCGTPPPRDDAQRERSATCCIATRSSRLMADTFSMSP